MVTVAASVAVASVAVWLCGCGCVCVCDSAVWCGADLLVPAGVQRSQDSLMVLHRHFRTSSFADLHLARRGRK